MQQCACIVKDLAKSLLGRLTPRNNMRTIAKLQNVKMTTAFPVTLTSLYKPLEAIDIKIIQNS